MDINAPFDALLAEVPPALRPILSVSERERGHQQEIALARLYHDGRQGVKLTPRLREFLGPDAGAFGVRLNFVQKVNRALSSRLIVDGFDCDADDEDEQRHQIEFAAKVWRGSRMKSKRAALHLAAIRDGEHFLLVDWDTANQRPRLTPHPRYVDPSAAAGLDISAEGDEWGAGEGMQMIYPHDDPDQPPLCAIKRWTERLPDARGVPMPIVRLTIYYPNRVEKYALGRDGWTLRETEPWTRDGKSDTELRGEPLGIPVAHLKTPGLRPLAREAIPLQKALNKVFIDMMAASDLDAWRLLVAFGWEPGDAAIQPGSIIGTTKPPNQASIVPIEASDPVHQIALVDKMVALMADVTDVPLSLLQRSAQRAAEGTLQEEKESFIALARDYADTIEGAYEDALRIARRLQNTFGTVAEGESLLDEAPSFAIRWGEFWARSTNDRAQEASARLASGYTPAEVQRRVWHEDEATIERMKISTN